MGRRQRSRKATRTNSDPSGSSGADPHWKFWLGTGLTLCTMGSGAVALADKLQAPPWWFAAWASWVLAAACFVLSARPRLSRTGAQRSAATVVVAALATGAWTMGRVSIALERKPTLVLEVNRVRPFQENCAVIALTVTNNGPPTSLDRWGMALVMAEDDVRRITVHHHSAPIASTRNTPQVYQPEDQISERTFDLIETDGRRRGWLEGCSDQITSEDVDRPGVRYLITVRDSDNNLHRYTSPPIGGQVFPTMAMPGLGFDTIIPDSVLRRLYGDSSLPNPNDRR